MSKRLIFETSIMPRHLVIGLGYSGRRFFVALGPLHLTLRIGY
ncbi:hypothetical protein [Roseateles violae]|uniref:Uncharacterized protein n=1 Tax=Roseateles violae TaxID=3058042 RepID=A0ABT8DT87_9BURK|nr:hypothetical protein [Pelomonas sp. PFR6]MDN3921515.1 hypothetical protein [Pelomonas sp. PFR6]